MLCGPVEMGRHERSFSQRILAVLYFYESQLGLGESGAVFCLSIGLLSRWENESVVNTDSL